MSNLTNIKMKDIIDFGSSTVEYKGYVLTATKDDDIEIVATKDGVEVFSVFAATMNEAKKLIEAAIVEVAEEVAETVAEEVAETVAEEVVETVVEEVAKPVPTTAEIAPKASKAVLARQEIRKIAEDISGMTNVHFETRGKYKDWFIVATDSDGKEFTQRLDVFRKKLRSAGLI
ncbi:coil containing protein [Vibrio phage 1.081.O._10N.286.52.C2]|nr:coil containing protein [Vibrio phage 1.081.O._10N.286.52.C2]